MSNFKVVGIERKLITGDVDVFGMAYIKEFRFSSGHPFGAHIDTGSYLCAIPPSTASIVGLDFTQATKAHDIDAGEITIPVIELEFSIEPFENIFKCHFVLKPNLSPHISVLLGSQFLLQMAAFHYFGTARRFELYL